MSFLSLNENIATTLLNNYQEIRNDYLSLPPESFSDFLSITQILESPKNSGHFWQIYLLIWKNKKLILPDVPPDRYKFSRQVTKSKLDLLTI